MQLHSHESLLRVHGLEPHRKAWLSSFIRAAIAQAGGFLRALLRRETAYRADLRQYKKLGTLPHHLLKDIGIPPETLRMARNQHGRGRLRDHWK